MYTIFKNECTIILTDSLKFKDDFDFFYWKNFDVNIFLQECITSNPSTVYLYHSDLEFLWKQFQKKFKIIEAAGGVVFNKKKELLFIFRNGKWDLPKGKVEKGESIQESALREVQEECGIVDLNLKEFIMETYHIYDEKNNQILKKSHWFKMKSDENSLIPQLEEGITKAEWKDNIEIQNALSNTYPNIKLLIKSVIS
ncbi:MAG: NUDIX domain-containing protein [Flavobacteriaceae bacterium]|nr:NUDIX domain-containing protein [Flavobacteriaceae bacterium]